MSKRFQKTRIVDKWGGIYDSETDEILSVNDVEYKLNEQQSTIQSLQKDIMEMSDSHQSCIEMESEIKSKVNDIIRTQQREIRKLSEENEQLRQKLDFYLLDEFEWKEKYGD